MSKKIEKDNNINEYRVQQFLIKEGNELYKYIMDSMYNSNNLYNATNFHIRQLYTGLKVGDVKNIHPLQNEIIKLFEDTIPEINKKNTKRFYEHVKKDIQQLKIYEKPRKVTRFNMLTEDKAFCSYELMDAVLKTSKNRDYKSLPAHVNQGVLKQVYNDWSSFFEGLKEYKVNSKKYKGKPKPPRYKTKGVANNVVFSNQVCKIKQDKRGKSYLRFPKTKLRFNLSKHLVEKLDSSSLVEVRAQKYYNDIQLEVVLKLRNKNLLIEESQITNVMAIDLGVNNLATCVSNNGMKPTIINGKPLKSINQYYNKNRAKLYSDLRINKKPNEGTFISKKLELLDKKRRIRIKDFMHKASKQILDLAIENNIHKVIVGYNNDFQMDVNIGKKNTQNFVNIPFGMFLSMLEYKLNAKGIHLRKVEESYTSKASFIDKDEIPTYDKKSNVKYVFSGKRKTRGLYESKNKIVINADVNGACNILRKHFDATVEISHKILSNIQKINIPKGSKGIISTLSTLFEYDNEIIIS